MVTDLLRGPGRDGCNGLNFHGVTVSDSFVMAPILDAYPPAEAAWRGLEAGLDVVLMPQDPEAAVNGIVGAVSDGSLPAERLQAAATNVYALRLALAGRRDRASRPWAPANTKPSLRRPAPRAEPHEPPEVATPAPALVDRSRNGVDLDGAITATPRQATPDPARRQQRRPDRRSARCSRRSRPRSDPTAAAPPRSAGGGFPTARSARQR